MPSSFYLVALPFLRVIYPYLRTETVYLCKVPYLRHMRTTANITDEGIRMDSEALLNFQLIVGVGEYFFPKQ